MKNYVVLFAIFISSVGKSVAENEVQWIISGENGYPCLITEMNIKTNFTYNSTSSQVKNILYEVPNNKTKVNLTSTCGNTESHLIVEWDKGNSFEITFTNGNKSYELSIFKITLNMTDVTKDSLENKTIEITYIRGANDTSFETPSNFSFHCTQEQMLNNTDNNAYILLSKVQFEAFKKDKNNKFSLAKDCENKHFKPEIVPIAVGLSLIALIIIVLIAYIVGRRRQQAQGYVNIM